MSINIGVAIVLGAGLLYLLTKKAADGNGNGNENGITHPKFQVGDVIVPIAGYPGSSAWEKYEITNYISGSAPNYGTYTVKWLVGSQIGQFQAMLVVTTDLYYRSP
jgi:hypothetical protein